MDLFKAALNSAQGFYNFNAHNGNDKLREQLYQCTYNDETKYIIEKAVRQVLHVYPYFQTEILSFGKFMPYAAENGTQKRFIEIKGVLEIQIRGKNCKVDYNMMIPNAFPKKPPYVRIINRNDYMVDPLYKNLKSPTDPKSFILNQLLQEVKRWNQNSSISNKIMRQNFPFLKAPKNESTNVSQGWANINQKLDPSWGASKANLNYGSGPASQGSFSGFNNQGFNNQGFNNQGFNSQGFNNQGFNNQGFNNQGYGFNNQGFNYNQPNPNMGGFNQGFGGYNVPPIPFQNNVNIGQAIANSQKFVGQSKKIMQKMKTEHIKAVQKIQQIETIKSSLDSQQAYLRSENSKISEFLRKSEKSDFKNMSELIRARDEKSEQILNLSSSIKARDDCISLLEDKFSQGDLTFEQFMKHVKKLEQQKFQEKVLLNKCIQI